jgi:hypothetical protein
MCRFINPNSQVSYAFLLLIIRVFSDYPGKFIYHPSQDNVESSLNG